MAPILIGALKLGPPGTLLNFVGAVLNVDAGFAAQVMSSITAGNQPIGENLATDVAHKIMAPPSLGECAARGRGVELVFDTRFNAHLMFLDDMMTMLDDQRAMGNVLGGWLSVRFTGPARAILSPQRSARSCTVEAVGLNTMRGTQPIFDAIEMFGVKHGATPHWGMFNSFSSDRVNAAFPRLDAWRRIRFQLTANGALHTFDNQFTHDSGLENPPACRSSSRMAGAGARGVSPWCMAQARALAPPAVITTYRPAETTPFQATSGPHPATVTGTGVTNARVL
jgi:hypothetical protein